MKAILAVVVVAVLMFWMGWMTFQRSNGQATLTVDEQKIQQDTEELIEDGKALVDPSPDPRAEPVEPAGSGRVE